MKKNNKNNNKQQAFLNERGMGPRPRIVARVSEFRGRLGFTEFTVRLRIRVEV